MKRFVGSILLLGVGSIMAFSQPKINIISSSDTKTVVEIFFEPLAISENTAVDNLIIKGCTQWQQKGYADIPKYTFSIKIPDNREAEVTVLEQQTSVYQNITIQPSKGKLSRIQNPENIALEYGDSYTTNSYFPATIATANVPYILRDYRGQAFHIAPVQYNAFTKQLNAYQYLKLEINYTKPSTENIIRRKENPSSIAETFHQLYSNHFLNYELEKKTRATPFLENDKMLVMCPQKFLTTIQLFVDWKKMKGIYTTLVNVDTLTGGVTQATVFNFIKNYYLDHGITHVLIVGNETDIPVMDGGTIYSTGSDNPYGYMMGSDHYAEILVGRFTGGITKDINAQVQKSVQYEKTPQTNFDWYKTVAGIASNDNSQGDDLQYDWQHERVICDSLITQGPYKKKLEFYDGTHGGLDDAGNPSSLNIIDSINKSGIGIINYTGHGSVGGIVTSNFSVNEIPLMHNTNGNWPCMLIVGCQAGEFVTPTKCLAESLAMAVDTINTKPVGTIINASSTVNQWWKEPMEAQDEFNNVLCDARPYPIKHSFAGMLINGFFSMMDAYNIPNDPDAGNQMTDTWEIFGDPSLVIKSANWGTIICGNSGGIPVGATSYTLSCNTDSADICLYYKGEILATAKSVSGVANFTFPAMTDTSLPVYITATKYNYSPYLDNTKNAVSIQNIVLSNAISVYPNPATEVLKIESTIPFSKVQIMNQVGAVMKNYISNNLKVMQVNMQDVSAGIYFLKIETEQGSIYKKISKQ